MNAFYCAIPTEKKKDVDIAGLAAFTKKGFIILGTMFIVLPFILKIFHLEEAYGFLILFMALGWGMLMHIKTIKYYKYNEKNNKIYVCVLWGIITSIILLLILLIEYTQR